MSLRPAAGSAFEWLQRDVAQWTGGTTAIRLMASALEDSTVEQYGRHWATFCTWCAENSLEPLPATPRMIVAYIGTLAERGSIGADSLQPYLSAINAMHADHGFERPALGHMVARARQGMRRSQALVQTRDTRVPLPADAVMRILQSTLAARPSLEQRPPRERLAFLRRRYAVVLAFVFMGRQDSCVHLRADDHGIDDSFLWLRLTEKQKRGWRFRRVIRLPLTAQAVRRHASALPLLAQLGRAYLAAREAALAFSSRAGAREPTALFQLPGEQPPRTADMSTWLSQTLSEEGISAAYGFAYQGHSLRSGTDQAARVQQRRSACRAIAATGWGDGPNRAVHASCTTSIRQCFRHPQRSHSLGGFSRACMRRATQHGSARPAQSTQLIRASRLRHHHAPRAYHDRGAMAPR